MPGMPTVHANGIDICYEERGSAGDPVLLLVNGFTSQLTNWDDQLIDLLVEQGLRVIRFDNRDVGLTTKTPGPPPKMALGQGEGAQLEEPPPYSLADMAADGMALLASLGVERAHVAGVSMGGMIVQHMAFTHPERVLTLTSIMSTPGGGAVGQPKAEVLAVLTTRPPAERDAYIEHSVHVGRTISGPQFDEARARARAATAYDRCYHPDGAAFQMAAIMADGDRTKRLAGVRCPTLVIHGRVDPLVPVSGGEATARAIDGAELILLDDMGHDLPVPQFDTIVGAIAKLTASA
jgi:pimeloyl-ACP methyl ester carboxylesterase